MANEIIQIDRQPLAAAHYPDPTTDPAAVYIASLQSANSRVTMAKQLDRIAELIGATSRAGVPWGSLRFAHTQAIRARLAERWAPATANLMLSALRGVLKAAWRLGYLDAESYHRAADLQNIKGERPDAAAGRALTRRELIALFDACADDESPAGARDAAILALGYAAGGLRRAEIVGLDLASYDATAQSLTVRGKGNKTRIVYVRGGALTALDDWLELRGLAAGPLFLRLQQGGPVGAVNQRLTEQAIYAMYKARAKQAGVADFSPHDVRRSFISDQIDAGTDLVTVAKLAGHSNVQTTARYDRRGERAKQAAADALHVPYRGRHDKPS